MKKYRLFSFLFVALLSGACTEKTDFANLSTLKGEWYCADAQNLVDSYVAFSNGYLTTYKADRMLPVSDGKIYNCTYDDFSVAFMEAYSILDGCLISEKHNFGSVSIDGDVLHIGESLYRRMTGVTSECFSWIELEQEHISRPPVGQILTSRFKVVNPVSGYERVSVSKCPEWVIGLKVGDGKMEFIVGAGSQEVMGRDSIMLSNPFSRDAVLYLDEVGPDIVTGDASHISCRNAVLSGTFRSSPVATYGVMYSTLSDVPEASSVKVEATLPASGSGFSITTEALKPETTYYYCAYVSDGGKTKRGDIKSFKTLDTSTLIKTLGADVINGNTAVLKGEIDLTDCKYTTLRCGFVLIEGGAPIGDIVVEQEIIGNRFSYNVTSLKANTDYSYAAYVFMDAGLMDSEQYFGEYIPFNTSYIDLGLSVFWATCNVGASKPEERGGHYRWAGTTDIFDAVYNLQWNNSCWHTGSEEKTGWTKYIPSDKPSYWWNNPDKGPDNKTVLDPEDDVAYIVHGGNWRMPTETEWKELLDNCNWQFTSLNGVNGTKVTSRKPGYTDRSIFLPAVGYRMGKEHKNETYGGNYWSSSLCVDSPSRAWGVQFFYSSNPCVLAKGERYVGYVVRPVVVPDAQK